MGKRASDRVDKHANTVCRICQDDPYPLRASALYGHVDCLKGLLPGGKSKNILAELEQQSILHAAAEAGRLEILKYLIEIVKLPPYHRNGNGDTCAHVAIYNGQFDCLEYLLNTSGQKRRPLALEKDARGNTVLHLAVIMGNNDIALWLLQRHGQAIANIANDSGQLPVHIASANENLEFIRIATNYDLKMVNKRDCDGATPAYYAARAGHLQALKYLVEKTRADVNAVTGRGHSLLHVACASGHPLVSEWLITKMKKNAISQRSQDAANPFHYAAFGGHTEVLKVLQKAAGKKKYLTTSVDRRGNMPIHLAALNGHIDCVIYLLESGSDVKTKNKAAHTPIDMALKRGHQQVAWIMWNFKKGKGKMQLQPMQIPSSVASSGYGSGTTPLGPNFRDPIIKSGSHPICVPWPSQQQLDQHHPTWTGWYFDRKHQRAPLSPNLERESITKRMDIGGNSNRVYMNRSVQTEFDPLNENILYLSDDHLNENWPDQGFAKAPDHLANDAISADSVSLSLNSQNGDIEDECIAATEHIDRVLEEVSAIDEVEIWKEKRVIIQQRRFESSRPSDLGPPLKPPIFYDPDTARKDTRSKIRP